jgi:hypothetical protein
MPRKRQEEVVGNESGTMDRNRGEAMSADGQAAPAAVGRSHEPTVTVKLKGRAAERILCLSRAITEMGGRLDASGVVGEIIERQSDRFWEKKLTSLTPVEYLLKRYLELDGAESQLKRILIKATRTGGKVAEEGNAGGDSKDSEGAPRDEEIVDLGAQDEGAAGAGEGDYGTQQPHATS